jgi:hypothetical protein
MSLARPSVYGRAPCRVLLLALLLLAGLALTPGVVAPAQAYHPDFCYDAFVSAHSNCYGTDHTLTGVQAYDFYGNDRVCAASHYQGALFASYACGDGFAEHCYSATHVLKPLIHNQEDFGQHMRGVEFFGEQCP